MRIVELEAEQKVSDKRFVWDGLSIAEERDASGGVVARFYAQGQDRPQSSTALYYTFDHLGSIREVVESGGYSVVARYDYDPYGRRTRVEGNEDVDFGFTGHYYHAESGLWLAPFRAYDPETGRWISRDPIEEEGGRNLHSYALSNPMAFFDPDGLAARVWYNPFTWGDDDGSGGFFNPNSWRGFGKSNWWKFKDTWSDVNAFFFWDKGISGCGFWECFARCIEKYDFYLQFFGQATIPFSALPKRLFFIKPTPFGGMPPGWRLTNVWRVLASTLPKGGPFAAKALRLRNFGRWVTRFGTPLLILDGGYFLAVEAYCAGSCLGDSTSY